MASDIRRVKIGVTLTVTLSLAIVLLSPSPVVPGVLHDAQADGRSLSGVDVSAVPQYIIDDAGNLADELFGDSSQKRAQFIDNLLAAYSAAKDRDFIIIFNPGGWGWAPLSDSPGWRSISNGIKTELYGLGYNSLMLNFQRTPHSNQGYLSEIMATMSLYPPKAEDLALRVDFLTRYLPDIKVILTGESNGTIICDKVMRILGDNEQVYSIQTGPPFWYTNAATARTLVMRSNGNVPDTFCEGDFFTIIRTNLEALLGLSQESPGHIMLYVGSPGHDYYWQYDEVSSRITGFLRFNFSPEQ